MAGWTTNLRLLQLKPGNPLADADVETRKLTEEAARVWLDAALKVVPTWSRASRATFEALAQAVGYNVTYGPVRAFSDRTPLGLKTGFGGIRKIGPANYEFYYRSELDYLNFNESNVARVGVAGVFKGLIHPTPYNFRDIANKAVESWFKSQKLGFENISITSGKTI